MVAVAELLVISLAKVDKKAATAHIAGAGRFFIIDK